MAASGALTCQPDFLPGFASVAAGNPRMKSGWKVSAPLAANRLLTKSRLLICLLLEHSESDRVVIFHPPGATHSKALSNSVCNDGFAGPFNERLGSVPKWWSEFQKGGGPSGPPIVKVSNGAFKGCRKTRWGCQSEEPQATKNLALFIKVRRARSFAPLRCALQKLNEQLPSLERVGDLEQRLVW